MAAIRSLNPGDLLALADCNLDPLTETYNIGFYLEYLAKWPHLCHVICGQSGNIEGYILGKVEASPGFNRPSQEPYDPATNQNLNYLPWHAHITALTIAPAARRLGHAKKLTEIFEQAGDARSAWFVDLYVRTKNQTALKLYESMGYSIYRRVVGYYNDGEDAFDMRKPLSRDVNRQTIRENGQNFHVDPAMVWCNLPSWTGGSAIKHQEDAFNSFGPLIECTASVTCPWKGHGDTMLIRHLVDGSHSLDRWLACELIRLRDKLDQKSEAASDSADDPAADAAIEGSNTIISDYIHQSEPVATGAHEYDAQIGPSQCLGQQTNIATEESETQQRLRESARQSLNEDPNISSNGFNFILGVAAAETPSPKMKIFYGAKSQPQTQADARVPQTLDEAAPEDFTILDDEASTDDTSKVPLNIFEPEALPGSSCAPLPLRPELYGLTINPNTEPNVAETSPPSHRTQLSSPVRTSNRIHSLISSEASSDNLCELNSEPSQQRRLIDSDTPQRSDTDTSDPAEKEDSYCGPCCSCKICEDQRAYDLLKSHGMVPDWLPKIYTPLEDMFVEPDDYQPRVFEPSLQGVTESSSPTFEHDQSPAGKWEAPIMPVSAPENPPRLYVDMLSGLCPRHMRFLHDCRSGASNITWGM